MSQLDKIKYLESEILKHKNLYYAGKAQISDEDFDKLENDLRELDPQNYVLDIVGSVVYSRDKVAHEKKMLSLNKTYKKTDLEKWKGEDDLVSTFKIDGSSCSLIFDNGLLKLAKTRGDGKFGENITNKALCMGSIPKKIDTYKNKLEVRGEIYCTEEQFLKLSEYMIEQKLEKPNSLRNIVAGILGRRENIELASFLDFQAFELISDEEIFQTEKGKFDILKSMGFKTPDFRLIKNKKDIQEELDSAIDFMSEGNYLIDGLVFTYNNIKKHEELGETAHHPRYKLAYKFQGETKDSEIQNISWQVSRNGILTPVANIKPVEISGAKVSRVTLHNYGVVKANELKCGDIIKIVRSGEVIPKFLEVVKESAGKVKYPSSCPSCKEDITEVDIRLICTNPTCPAQVKDTILNFIQKIGIEDLSSKRLEELIKAKLVTTIDDLYRLDKEDLMKLDKIKDKLATKLLSSIEKSKDTDLITFLSALGISGGAYNKCEKIVDAGVNTIEKVKELTVEQLINIESFAQKSASDFLLSLKSKDDLIDKLINEGFDFSVKKKKDSSISGKKFCITGTLTMKRSDLQKMIKENSGIAVSSVSKDTDFLITNDTQSSSNKFKKAQELNIQIINEEKFLEML